MNPAKLAMMGIAGMLYKDKSFLVPKIPSHKIEAKEEDQQLSKRKIQKLKGKKKRKNRGKNR
ncbi:MAG: hypothetical protein NWE89_13655 [Candidatus Bathyarchaeota archaeon]|nr:hypothetical protein [Candidatus Bathyarchaeota archaeon]